MSSFFNPYYQTSQERPKRRIFISFHMEDLHFKKLLEHQAKSDKFQLEFTNYSLQTPFDHAWKTQCAARIQQCSATLCLIGKQTWSRDAVIWELNKSYELGKLVFGVTIYNNDPYLLIPAPLVNNNSWVVQWNMEQIQSVLDRMS